MSLWEKICEIFPELSSTDDFEKLGIFLKDDGDGIEYIADWKYHEPLPSNFKLGK